MIEKEFTKEQAVETFNRLLDNKRDILTFCVDGVGGVVYNTVNANQVLSELGERIVSMYSDYYRTEIKFLPIKGGKVKMVVY